MADGMHSSYAPRVYLSLFLLSAAILCYEIVSTRIASVIFVQDYAFIILSLALLGLGSGGVFSYYKSKGVEDPSRVVFRSAFVLGVTLLIFVIGTITLSVTNPFVFFVLGFLPFFSAGVVYAELYKVYASLSFKLYTSDLLGAAVGSVASLGMIGLIGAPNSVIAVALVSFAVAALSLHPRMGQGKRIFVYSVLVVSFAALFVNGQKELFGMVPIGNYPEKDFYSVYPNASTTATIIDSRWSIYGRSDLVRYSDQDMVQQLFVDGAAGTQVYRFNGNVRNTQSMLQGLLLQHTTAIPFLCLKPEEKRSMLVIGPGGGKEVLLGLFGEVDTITGVEINPDFVNIVRDHKAYDGGIYSAFSNVRIVVEEGRHYVKQTRSQFDLIVMALPSTEQMQNIEPFATSENYLMTKEAFEDYLERLTPGGRLIFTVHNEWELMRLMTTAVEVFQSRGLSGDDIKEHFAVFEAAYAPTVVIKKEAFSPEEAQQWEKTCLGLPRGLPTAAYLPHGRSGSNQAAITRFLASVSQSPERAKMYMSQSKDDITPCTDDKPYFYKTYKGVPNEYLWLLVGTVGFNLLVVWLPFRVVRKKTADTILPRIFFPLMVLICTGIGFMVLEVSLFQKLVLYLGSPTISLSILLSSLLVGMGIGSYFGQTIYGADVRKRLYVVSIAIVAVGILLFTVSPGLLTKSLGWALPLRAATSFLVILPLALLLGIPFPTCIQLLRLGHQDRCIPWLYGVNGSMSVLGSVLAVNLSMLFGFTPAFFVGLFFYLCVFLVALAVGRRAVTGVVVK